MKKLIKFFSGLGALLLMLIGIAILAVAIYGFFNPSIFVGDTSTKNTVLGILLGVSIAIIGGCIEGLIGICKQNPKMICYFQIIVIVFMAIFIGLGVGLLLLPGILFQGDCTQSTNIAITQINSIYNNSRLTFCTSNCSCTFSHDNSTLISTYSPQQIVIINAYFQYSPSGANTSQDCIKSQSSAEEIALFSTVGEFEKLFSCSLWCQGSGDGIGNLIYRFQDVSTSGRPQKYCYTAVKDAFNNYNYYAKIGTFVAAGILLAMFIGNMYLCCSPKRRNRRLRDRFVIIDEDDRDDNYAYDYRQPERNDKYEYREGQRRRDNRRR